MLKESFNPLIHKKSLKMSNQPATPEQAKSFETILTLQKDLLAARAWRICYILAGFCLMLSVILLIFVVTQKKEIVLIRVDNRTGEADVLSQLKETSLTQDEAVEKFFSSRYLILREQYDYFSLQHDYETVQLFSSDVVQRDYLKLFESIDSPYEMYGQNFNNTIDIISITISPATEPSRLASIRFRKKISDIANNKTRERFYTARIVFDFNPERKVPEKFRLANPLGFKVVSYQVSPELTEH